MTTTMKLMIAALATLASGSAALAHSNDARLDEQAATIEEGRREGSITWLEGRKLRKDQREIERVKAAMEADGHLSREEKRVLYRMQDAAEDHIEAEATDTRHRASWLPRFGK